MKKYNSSVAIEIIFLYFQLGETLQMECPKLNFQIVKLEKEGICIRFAPLECAQGSYMYQYLNVLEGTICISI